MANKLGYLPALDGLRAVSVLAVVAYHLGEVRGGFLGVDVFFVVSGFLITRLLLAEREHSGAISLRSFWVRRFKRLLPALLVVLVAVAIGSRLWLPAWRLTAIRIDALAALAYVANWRFILSGQSYFASGVVPSPLRHTWSLAIEEQFYVVWPLLVVALARLGRVRLRTAVAWGAGLGAFASGAWMAVAAATGRDLSRIYYGTDTRAFALLAGAWLATWWDPASVAGTTRVARRVRARRWAAAGTAAAVPAVVLLAWASTSSVGFYQGGFQAMAVLSVLVVAGVATGEGPLAGLLATRPLVWIGRRSYGIYLWSWPTQVFAQEHFELDGLVLDAVVVVLAVVLAALSHWLVEEPIRLGTRPQRERRPPVPRLVAPSLAVAMVVGVVVTTSAGAPPPPDYTTVSDAEALRSAIEPMTAKEEAALRATTTAPPPVEAGPPGPFAKGDTLVIDPSASADPRALRDSTFKVLVTGDSVGWSLAFRLGPDLTHTLWVDDKALLGCGAMPWTAKFIVKGRPPEQYPDLCANAEIAELQGLARKPSAVLLWLGAWEVYDHEVDGVTMRVGTKRYATYLEARIQQRIDRYRANGVPTIMPVVPCFGPNAARLGTERHQQRRLRWVNDRIRAVAKRNRGWVRLVDPVDLLCDARGKAKDQTTDGQPLREDGAHFTSGSAVWFWNTWLAGQMGAAFDLPAGPIPPNTIIGPAGG